MTDYYANAATGNDTAAGTSEATALRTLAAMSTKRLKAGDRLLLAGTFRDALYMKGAGVLDAPVEVLPYGDGALIDGLAKIEGPWVEVSPNDNVTPKPGSQLWLNSSPPFHGNCLLVLDGKKVYGAADATGELAQPPLTTEYAWKQTSSGTLLNCHEDPARHFKSIEAQALQRGISSCPFALIAGIKIQGTYSGAFIFARSYYGQDLEGCLTARHVFSLAGPGVMERCRAHDNGEGTGEGEHGFVLKNTEPTEVVQLIDCEAWNIGEDCVQLSANIFKGYAILHGGRYQTPAENFLDVKCGTCKLRGGLWASSHQQAPVTIQQKGGAVTIEDVCLNAYRTQPVIQCEQSAWFVLRATKAGGPRMWTLNSTGILFRKLTAADSDLASSILVAEGASTANGAIHVTGSGPNGHSVSRMTVWAPRGIGLVVNTGLKMGACEGNIMETGNTVVKIAKDAQTGSMTRNHLYRATPGETASTGSEKWSAPQIVYGDCPVLGGPDTVAGVTAAFERFPIKAIERAGNQVTITIPGNVITDGEAVLVRGYDVVDYNGWHYMKKLDANRLSYRMDSDVPLPATGGEATRMQLTEASPDQTCGSRDQVYGADGRPFGTRTMGALPYLAKEPVVVSEDEEEPADEPEEPHSEPEQQDPEPEPEEEAPPPQ